MLAKKLGFNFLYEEDNTDYYQVGENSKIPLSLILLSVNNKSNNIERYFSYYLEHDEACKAARDFSNQKLRFDSFVYLFDNDIKDDIHNNEDLSVISPWKPPKFNSKLIHEPDYDLVMDFNVYADYFKTYFSMLTNFFNSSDSYHNVPQVPSILNINFHQRTEFQNVHKSIDIALSHILDEVFKVCKKRKFNVFDDYTVFMSDFQAIKFSKDNEFKFF